MPRRRVTQADVAALAGVSQTTVSFVLSGRTPAGVRISEDTRKRVLDAIHITGYSANPVAQRLAGGHNQILGVFTYETTFPRHGRDFYGPFLIGIEHAAEQLGVDLLLFTSAKVVDGSRRLVRDGWQRLGIADGCLLIGQYEERAELQHLVDTNYPFVFVGKREVEGGNLPYVGADYRTATHRAVTRAAEVGHTRIGYIGARSDDQPTTDRLAGYRAGMAEHGLEEVYIDPVNPASAAAGIVDHQLTSILLSPENDPDGVRMALAAHRVRVPEDVSVLLLGQPHHLVPGPTRWSGYTIPREEMGARALLLLSRLVGTAGPDSPPAAPLQTHQLLECAEVQGETLIAPPSITEPPSTPIVEEERNYT